MPEKSRSKVLFQALLFAGAILLAGCKSVCSPGEPIAITGEMSALVDRSLLTQEPCAPPCWQGITPGETQDEEAIELVEKLEFIKADSLWVNRGSEGGIVTWETVFSEDEGASTGGVFFDANGTVSRITVPRLWYYITLQELIEVIGEPDGIITRPQMGFTDISGDCAQINVVWFRKGLEVSIASVPLDQADKALSLVQPDLLITSAYYLPSTSDIEAYSENLDKPSLKDLFTPWEGFGH